MLDLRSGFWAEVKNKHACTAMHLRRPVNNTKKGVSNWKRRDNLAAALLSRTPATPFEPQWSRVAAAAACDVHCSVRATILRACGHGVCYLSCIGLLLAQSSGRRPLLLGDVAPIDSPPCSSRRAFPALMITTHTPAEQKTRVQTARVCVFRPHVRPLWPLLMLVLRKRERRPCIFAYNVRGVARRQQ